MNYQNKALGTISRNKINELPVNNNKNKKTNTTNEQRSSSS